MALSILNFVENFGFHFCLIKWKGEEDAQEYEDAASILGAVIKHHSMEINPVSIDCKKTTNGAS